MREFILGGVFAPALVCFAWMTILGGTAMDLELFGQAEGAISGASNTAKLFVTLGQMIDGGLLTAITVMCVVLVLTFLVTSADSGILVMNTIMSGGDQDVGNKHKVVWGLILTAVIGALFLAAGEANPMDALRNAMIIGALPFTMVMGLMACPWSRRFNATACAIKPSKGGLCAQSKHDTESAGDPTGRCFCFCVQ